MKSIHMENTKIPVTETIGEIQALLAKSGASKIMIDYSEGEPCGLTFSIPVQGKELYYKLPARVEKLFEYFQSKRAHPHNGREQDTKQAKMTGWRQILRWLQAQFALMDVGMVDIAEVFLPYCYNGEQTVYQLFAAKEGIKLLEQ